MTLLQLEILAWFVLTVALLVYTLVGAIEYALDLRELYRDPDVTRDQREVAWSNLRNEIGRMLTAQLFLYFGGRAVWGGPEWITHVQLFALVFYKLWSSIKDRRLRLMLLQEKRDAGDHLTGV
jgi:hypothetical protein